MRNAMSQLETYERESSRNGIETIEEAVPFGLDFVWPDEFWMEWSGDKPVRSRADLPSSMILCRTKPEMANKVTTGGYPVFVIPSNLDHAIAVAKATRYDGVLLCNGYAGENKVLARWYVR